MKILEKKNFIKEEKKKINKDNPYALATKQRILLVVEKKIALKFVIVSLLFLVFIFLLNYFFDNHYFNVLMGSWITDIYIKYIKFPLSDPDSARYFFSSIPQTLAALIAISFTLLLIYLQISTDKYSIHTVRSLFDGWDAIAVLSVFLITILYSLYNLALVRDMKAIQYPWDTKIKTIFILSVICCIALMLFFYRIIHQLTPEIFIRQSCKRMKDAFILNLDLTQSLYIKNNFYAKEITKINNIEESFFFGAWDSVDYIYNVKSSKRGFVEDIDTSKIEKCSNRSRIPVFFQPGNASAEASTASATSPADPAGTRSISSPVAGFFTSIHASSGDETSFPPILISMTHHTCFYDLSYSPVHGILINSRW